MLLLDTPFAELRLSGPGNAGMNFNKVNEYLRRHGLMRTAHRCGYCLLSRAFGYMHMRCMWVSITDLRVEAAPQTTQARGRFLPMRELLEFAGNGAGRKSGLTEQFVRQALENHEKCFGMVDGKNLAAFTWYSEQSPTFINKDWVIHFDPRCVYVYFVYTDPAYRGGRLLAHGLKEALEQYQSNGKKRALAFVESCNYASLNAFYRMGYKDFGSIRVFKLFGKSFALHNRGCDLFQFRVTPNTQPLARAA
jgi:GNAT superfamily N-acetyltransferase